MGKRRDDGLAAVIFLGTSRLPWWAGVVLAVASYVGFTLLATQQFPETVSRQDIGSAVVGRMFTLIAGVLRYIVPVLFLAGAGWSVIRARSRASLASGVANSPAAESLNAMTWQQFEALVGEAFRRKGYQVVERGGSSADGGIDLVLRKDSEKYLVQCKQWRAVKVGVTVVRELYGVMAATGAAGGFVVTSGRYTDEAIRFAKGRNVVLLDGAKLHAMVKNVVPIDEPRPTGLHVRKEPLKADVSNVDCPRCGRPMVKRTAKRGSQVGAEFWGCTAYPSCKGTRPLAEAA